MPLGALRHRESLGGVSLLSLGSFDDFFNFCRAIAGVVDGVQTVIRHKFLGIGLGGESCIQSSMCFEDIVLVGRSFGMYTGLSIGKWVSISDFCVRWGTSCQPTETIDCSGIVDAQWLSPPNIVMLYRPPG